MLTIAPCMRSDCGTIATLWNAKRLDANSCWFGAVEVDTAAIEQTFDAGFSISIASLDGTPVGFGLWNGTADLARMVAVAADTDEVYFRLLREFCSWGLALGASLAYAEIGVEMTTERSRIDALGVIELVAIGFDPLAPGQEPAERVPRLLRAQCDLSTLKTAVTQILEPAP